MAATSSNDRAAAASSGSIKSVLQQGALFKPVSGQASPANLITGERLLRFAKYGAREKSATLDAVDDSYGILYRPDTEGQYENYPSTGEVVARMADMMTRCLDVAVETTVIASNFLIGASGEPATTLKTLVSKLPLFNPSVQAYGGGRKKGKRRRRGNTIGAITLARREIQGPNEFYQRVGNAQADVDALVTMATDWYVGDMIHVLATSNPLTMSDNSSARKYMYLFTGVTLRGVPLLGGANLMRVVMSLNADRARNENVVEGAVRASAGGKAAHFPSHTVQSAMRYVMRGFAAFKKQVGKERVAEVIRYGVQEVSDSPWIRAGIQMVLYAGAVRLWFANEKDGDAMVMSDVSRVLSRIRGKRNGHLPVWSYYPTSMSLDVAKPDRKREDLISILPYDNLAFLYVLTRISQDLVDWMGAYEDIVQQHGSPVAVHVITLFIHTAVILDALGDLADAKISNLEAPTALVDVVGEHAQLAEASIVAYRRNAPPQAARSASSSSEALLPFQNYILVFCDLATYFSVSVSLRET